MGCSQKMQPQSEFMVLIVQDIVVLTIWNWLGIGTHGLPVSLIQTSGPNITQPLKSEAFDKILEINKFKTKDDVNSDSVGLPQNFVIDFEDKIIRPSKDSLVRKTSRIERIVHIENKLILQGVQDGVENVDDELAWSVVISKKTGTVVLSAAGDGIGYVVFGRCWIDQKVRK